MDKVPPLTLLVLQWRCQENSDLRGFKIETHGNILKIIPSRSRHGFRGLEREYNIVNFASTCFSCNKYNQTNLLERLIMQIISPANIENL